MLIELKDITNIMELTDEHSLTNYRLYQNSVEILKERNKLNIQFETTLVGLIQNLPRDNAWNEWIVLGDFVNLEEENLMETGEGHIRIVGFTYIPKEHKISSISFSNRDKNLDELSKSNEIEDKSRIENLKELVSDAVDFEKTYDTAANVSFVHDVYRTLKGGQPFLIMESTPSLVNWHKVNKTKRPGVR